MALFAQVIQAGSMSAAARELGLTASAVSQQIRQLETDLGVTLLHRSTRRLGLSEAGEVFLEGCNAMVVAARHAEQRLADLRDAPVGELRLTAPADFARSHLAPALAPWLLDHPRLTLRLFASDERMDLIEQRIDLAIRVGRLPDSSLVARRLGTWEEVLCAAPSYLRRRGLPQRPGDLLAHDWLSLTVLTEPVHVELTGVDGQLERLRLEPRLAGNSASALRELALAGLGVVRQPLMDIADELRTGRLVRLLPDWRLPELGVFAITPRRDEQPAKVRQAIEAVREYLQGVASSGESGRRQATATGRLPFSS